MAENIVEVFFRTADKQGGLPCYHYKMGGVWKTLTWNEFRDQVCKLAAHLESLPVKKGERVGVYAQTRMEWTLADLAIMACGAMNVPIYHTFSKEHVEHIIKDSDIHVIFTENKALQDNVGEIARRISRQILVIPMLDETAHSVPSILARPINASAAAIRNRASQIGSDDVATIVYTSGTTGFPKGVVLTHGNILSEIKAVYRIYRFSAEQIGFLCLPLAHVLGRLMEFHHFMSGYQIAFLESYEKFSDNCREVRPHIIVGVPRILEKIHERIHASLERGPLWRRRLFEWGLSVGRNTGNLEQKHLRIPVFLRFKLFFANWLIFKKIRKRLGGRVSLFVSGGAALGSELAKDFQAMGLLIMEGYGLTETFAAVTVNCPDDYHFGTVGKPIHGVEVRISDEGEILVRGPTVFREYLNLPKETHGVKTPDGWFRTGDIGEISRDGFLRITDRLKDLIITAGGENVAPQMIETSLMESRYINYCMIYGDKKKYLTALVTLNPDAIREYASQFGIEGDFRELASHPRVKKLIESVIQEKNVKFARFETIKKFVILDHDFSQDSGELTPTLKVRRRFTAEKYKDVLEGLYRE